MLSTIGHYFPFLAVGAASLFMLAIAFVALTDRDPAPTDTV